MKKTIIRFPNSAFVLLFLIDLLSTYKGNGQIIPHGDSLSRYYYQHFNSANLKIKNTFRSIANCYNFKTDSSVPVRIPNLFIALYDDKRKELACLIDSTGKKLVDSIGINLVFFNNSAIVLKRGKYAIVNNKGELKTPFTFKKCTPDDLYNPFKELVRKQNNYDFFFQPIVTQNPLKRKYGLIDCSGKLLVDTIYVAKYKILTNPKEKSKTGLLYENMVFKSDTGICIVNFETGRIIFNKWRKENYILPIPLVYNNKQYYVFSSNLTYDFGLIDEDANIVLANKFENILTYVFSNVAFSTSRNVKLFCDALLYDELRQINNKEINNSFVAKGGKTSIVNIPQYIFIKTKDMIGVFNMEKLKVVIPCKYKSIYKNNKGQVMGYLKNGDEELLRLP